MEVHEIITILGPTATGKTKLAVALASTIGGEIISADSRQVYKGMDLGTGKDLSEYNINGVAVPYHLIDIKEPTEEYNAFCFRNDSRTVIKDITSRGKTPILCGGTGLYLESLLLNYQFFAAGNNTALRFELEQLSTDELANRFKQLSPGVEMDFHNRHRLIRAIEVVLSTNQETISQPSLTIHNNFVFGIQFNRRLLRQRIAERLSERLQCGMIEEVKELINQGVSEKRLISLGLEYKFVTLFLTGELSYEQMQWQLQTAIGQFAKRQETWFRRMEKRGINIHNLDGNWSLEEKLAEIQRIRKTSAV